MIRLLRLLLHVLPPRFRDMSSADLATRIEALRPFVR